RLCSTLRRCQICKTNSPLAPNFLVEASRGRYVGVDTRFRNAPETPLDSATYARRGGPARWPRETLASSGVMLRYISTRGEAPPLGFVEATLTGLARDGGLYVPSEWPRLDAET